MVEGVDELDDELETVFLHEVALVNDAVEQFTPLEQVHHQIDVLFSLVNLVQLDDVLVRQMTHDVDFVEQPQLGDVLLVRVHQLLLIIRLDGILLLVAVAGG